jgi:7,8-dihydropterin-6-yl-methyl-4-(beta-D-ribofuranosyl)aminobenzene 5'-phosphate synthase
MDRTSRPACGDRVEVLVLVDNVSDLLSAVPASVTPEVPNLLKAGGQELSAECICCAHWGLSLVVTAHSEDRWRTLLFDSGPEGYAVERNGDRLGLDFGWIEAAVLSHGHWDHAGGMLTALRRITAVNGGRRVPVHVNPGMFVRRASRRPASGPGKPIAGAGTCARVAAPRRCAGSAITECALSQVRGSIIGACSPG